MSVCLSVCVFTFDVPFKHLFAPTSWSQMSKFFRHSEFLGKSYGKKWSQIWTFLFGSGLKFPNRNKCFFWLILPYKTRCKPRFPMDWHISRCFWIFHFGKKIQFFKIFGFLGILGPPGNPASRWITDLWSKGVLLILAYFQTLLSFCVLNDFLRFEWFFPFFKKIMFSVILGPPYYGIGANIRIGQQMLCLPYAWFLLSFSMFSRLNLGWNPEFLFFSAPLS